MFTYVDGEVHEEGLRHRLEILFDPVFDDVVNVSDQLLQLLQAHVDVVLVCV